MKSLGRTRRISSGRRFFLVLAIAVTGCTAPDPLLSFLDDESSVSFTYPPRWNVGAAEQGGLRYRYLTAPKVEGDTEALSVTLIAPTGAATADALAQAYLSGGSGILATATDTGAGSWTFKDSSGVVSRLHLAPAPGGRFFGAWVRGSAAAMTRYASRIDIVLDSLHFEDPALWPAEQFAGTAARAPAAWTRGSRLSNSTNATMQFKSLALGVERGTATIHGFATISKEPVPPPGDLAAFSRVVKDRGADTEAVIEHRPWPTRSADERSEGLMDYVRSGNAMTATRIRRWITVRNGIGLMFKCEARADVFDRLDPWCLRMASTVRLE